MTDRRPRWSWLLFPQLFVIVAASVLAACRCLPPLALDGGLDKLGHFLMLGTLSLLAVGFFGAARWRRVVFVLAHGGRAGSGGEPARHRAGGLDSGPPHTARGGLCCRHRRAPDTRQISALADKPGQ